jgi:hypothetical protein
MKTSGRDEETPRWGRRIVWLLAIWTLSVGAMALVALALKGVMRLAGLTT